MSYDNNIYYNPENYGLETMGLISWDEEPYQFEYTAVWRDPATSELFWGDDSGCSCPSPFEEYTGRDDPNISRGTWHELNQHLNEYAASKFWHNDEQVPEDIQGQIAELMGRVTGNVPD